jgi:hypothetical protein
MVSKDIKQLTREEVAKVWINDLVFTDHSAELSLQHNKDGDLVIIVPSRRHPGMLTLCPFLVDHYRRQSV